MQTDKFDVELLRWLVVFVCVTGRFGAECIGWFVTCVLTGRYAVEFIGWFVTCVLTGRFAVKLKG